MKAVQIKKFGGPEVLEISDIEKPKPGKGQVLVKVYASSVNPFDVKFSGGMMPNAKLPIILGGDMAGVVAEVGDGVENVSVGKKVYGSANALAGATGAFAEFAAIPTGMIAKMPSNIDFKEAAASVLVGVSAVQGLLEHMKLQPGQKILIHGGAGGIGTMAIQIAKSIGAFVATTATGDGIDYVKKLGADQVINYKNENFEEVLQDFDAVFDTVGGQTYEKSFKVLKKGGVIVSMLMAPDEKLMQEYGVTAISQFTQVTTERLNTLTDFIENKGLKIHIDKVFLLEKIKEAFQEKQSEDIKGKIVIDVQE